jgi:hypothetical protein
MIDSQRPDTLWIVPRSPDRTGPRESRSVWNMLARAAVKGRPRVMVETPQGSGSAQQAALSGRGVILCPNAADGEEGLRRSLRIEIGSRHFTAIFVVGGESVRRWLPWARRTAPASRVIAVLTEERCLAGIRGPGAAARRRILDETRRAIAHADAAWCADGGILRATRALLRGAAAPEPTLIPHETAWLRGRAPARFAARVEAIILGGADEGRIAAALQRVASGRSRTRRVETRGEGAVAALNQALSSARAPLIWLCLNAFETPDASLLSVLTEGLAARPYAGGALPLAGPLPAGLAAAQYRTAWSISRKGDWHEADLRAHFCCLLLRRDALRAVGALDERLLGVDAALIDLNLRLALAGRPLFEARDALVRGPARPAGLDPADRETLAGKWGAGALRLLESLVTALEPRDYRIDPTVRAGFQGTA